MPRLVHPPSACSRMALVLLAGTSALFAQAPGPVPLPHPEIAPPPVIPEPWPVLLIVATSLAALALLAWLVWLIVRMKPLEVTVSKPALRLALSRLEDLQRKLDELPPPEAAHEVSLILRDYQEDRYAVPAPFRTSEELYASQAGTREELKPRFGPLAAIHDRIAFAPQPSSHADVADLIRASVRALEDEKNHPFSRPPAIPRN